MGVWLSVVGIGEDGLAGLEPRALERIESAEVLVGAARHLGLVETAKSDARRMRWPSPLPDGIAALDDLRPARTVVLASGDPMWFGIGATLARRYPPAEMEVLPHVSSFALAAARLGWALADTECISLHGRPEAALEARFAPGVKLLALTSGPGAPAAVAGRLVKRGFGPSRVTVLERLGGPAERIRTAAAGSFDFEDVDRLNLVAVECRPGPTPEVLSCGPGLPDDVFDHDGQITKREVRAATIARLMPLPGALLWDVGAGCGSVAIEWLRCAPRSRAVAIERRGDRRERMRANADRLGVPHLAIVAAEAPAALSDLPSPDAVFLGGGLSGQGGSETLKFCLTALAPGGRLVANAVTLETEAALIQAHRVHGGELVRLSIAQAGPVGPYRGWRAAMPVTQWAWSKPWSAVR